MSLRQRIHTVWPLLYLIWSLPFLVAIEHATPPWQNSDEPLHMARAVQVAHGGLAGFRAWGTSGGFSDGAIYDAYAPVQHVAMHPDQRPTAAELAASGSVPWSASTRYTSFPNTAQYPPFFYMPDALAYWAGRAAGQRINQTLTVARLANAAMFAAIAALALAIARRSRLPLTAILMLPMTLSLACSAAQDSLMLATTTMAVALVDRLADQARAARNWELIAIAACLVSIGMARPPYAGFLLLLLVTGPKPGRGAWSRLAAASALVLAWCAYVALRVSVRLGGADMPRQIEFLRANFNQIPAILGRTLTHYTNDYSHQFIGKLGWTDTDLPAAYRVFAAAVLGLALLAGTQGRTRRPWVACAAICFCIVTTFVLQYLTWTWPGQPMVTGVLGRYFLPPAMAAALALPRLHLPRLPITDLAALGLISFALVTPPVVLSALHARYAIQGVTP